MNVSRTIYVLILTFIVALMIFDFFLPNNKQTNFSFTETDPETPSRVIPRHTTIGKWDRTSLSKSLKQTFWYRDKKVISRTRNCESYFKHFVPVPAIDSGTPLAFSHLVHTQAAIFEVFLSLYFRPNNFHCIHIDKKSNSKFKEAITNLVKCYSTKIKTGKIFILSEKNSFSVD